MNGVDRLLFGKVALASFVAAGALAATALAVTQLLQMSSLPNGLEMIGWSALAPIGVTIALGSGFCIYQLFQKNVLLSLDRDSHRTVSLALGTLGCLGLLLGGILFSSGVEGMSRDLILKGAFVASGGWFCLLGFFGTILFVKVVKS
jgi:hypothetical protein